MMDLRQQIIHKINYKTKPIGALGVLEDIALKVALIQQTEHPQILSPSIVVFAADHGLASEGVSAYPPEVTYQMVMNFLAGGAAINVFARQHDIDIKIVDAGVNFDFPAHPMLRIAKAAYGTNNILHEAAMSPEQLSYCLDQGMQVVRDIRASGSNCIGFGEMGIGNTSSASLIMSALLGLSIEECTGRGTGLSPEQLEHKIATLAQAQGRHAGVCQPLDILSHFGGFEIAQMTGAMIQAYRENMLIMVDGFIATAALALADTQVPGIVDNCVFCHTSEEQAHSLFLRHLGARAILNLDLRLGEGTGCALAFPLIKSAMAFLNEMASFEEAGVSNNEAS